MSTEAAGRPDREAAWKMLTLPKQPTHEAISKATGVSYGQVGVMWNLWALLVASGFPRGLVADLDLEGAERLRKDRNSYRKKREAIDRWEASQAPEGTV